MAACHCAHGEMPDIGQISFSLDPKLPETKKFLHKNGFDLGSVGDTDLHVHRLKGDANGIPMWPVQMISVETVKPSAKAAGRRFMARIYEEFIDFELTVKSAGASVVEVTIAFFSPSREEVPNLRFRMDLATGWVIKTRPDIRGMEAGQPLSALQRMTYMASTDKEQWDLHCLIHVILHVGGLCAWLCAGGAIVPGIGQLGCLVVFLLCVSPAVVAAIMGCKKRVRPTA